MHFERYLECEHCHYVRASGDEGREFDELDPFGPPGRAGDPLLLCQVCLDVFSQCECCGAYSLGDQPYESRHGVAYCRKCHDAGCDLMECSRVPELAPIVRKLRVKRDKNGKPIQEPAFSTPVQNDGPTEEELAATYKSLGYEYHMNYKPEEGKQ